MITELFPLKYTENKLKIYLKILKNYKVNMPYAGRA